MRSSARRAPKPLTAIERHKFLHEVLGALGTGEIDVASFWCRMASVNLKDSDIDQYLRDEYLLIINGEHR